MTFAESLRVRLILASAGCALVLTALLLCAAPSAVHAAEVNGYGELTRFGETGDLGGQLDETRTRAIGVDPTDNSVYVLDEPEEGSGTKRKLRLQKFAASGGKYALTASVTITETSPELAPVATVEPAVEGLAIDPSGKRVYFLAADLRGKALKQASREGGKGILVASTLYAFSTEPSGATLVPAAETKAGGVVAGPAELEAQSETPGKALLAPRGITVDPATHEAIIFAHVNEGDEKEDQISSAKDHYVLQRVTKTGTLGDRYTDKTDRLKEQGEFSFKPLPNSPVVVSAGGKEHVYLIYAGLAEVPYEFKSTMPPTLIAASKNPQEGIEFGLSSGLGLGGRLTAGPDGTIYGTGDAIIENEEPGSSGERRDGIVAFSGADGSPIGWTGGQQLHETAPQEKCVISPAVFNGHPLVAAGSEGKVFALAPEFLLRQVEGEPIIEEIENPPGSEEFEEVETPTFEQLSGPFFPALVEFGPGGSGCPQASATAPAAKVNGIEVKGEEAVRSGSEVAFSSHLKRADALKVEWDFGDGNKQTVSGDQAQDPSVKHKYEKEGKFTVTETISVDNLASATQSVYRGGELVTPTITLTRAILISRPLPSVIFSAPETVTVGQTASFESHSTDPNGPSALPLENVWSFGDGAPPTASSSAASVTHAYSVAGAYTVRLTVTDQLGTKNTASRTVIVSSPASKGSGGGGQTPHTSPTTAASPPATTTTPTSTPSGGVLSYKVALASTSLPVSPAGAVPIKVNCLGQSSCAGTVTLRTLTAVSAGAGKKKAVLTLASASFTVAGGKVKVLTLHLSAKARGLLARSHVLRARATIVARDSSGASHTTAASVTLKVVKTKHH